MKHCDNVPQCFCGHVFSTWPSQIKHSEVLNGGFSLTCPDCKRELGVRIKNKQFFDVWSNADLLDKKIEFDKEMVAWTYIGKRHDGSYYVASLFPTEDAVKSFCDENKFVAEAIGQFKGVFKMTGSSQRTQREGE